ncbi:MAG: hypothetical protein IJ161_02925 [Bacteroidales bacterium]|nr:hypothetical protein [Bacteroidales bacterium]
MTDTEGTTYKFSERETTGRYLEAASPEPPFGEATVEMTAQSSSTVTAWYLTEIATADRTDVITLTYESMDYFSTEHRSFSRTYNFSYIYNGSGSYDWIGDYANASTSHAISPATSSIKTTLSWQPRVISVITYAGGSVKFEYEANTIPQSTQPRRSYPKRLKSMTVRDASDAKVRAASFSLTTFSGDVRNLLTEVALTDMSGAPVETWQLSYYSPQTNMWQYAKDLFGYYNGASGNQDLVFLRLFNDNYTFTETLANRNYSSASVSALSLASVTTASGSKTDFIYEGNSMQTNGSSALFSELGIGHRIKRIATYDLSGGSAALVRQREFSYSGQGITVPLSAFNVGAFLSVTENFTAANAMTAASWCAPNGIERSATVSFSDQSVLPGAALESARIYYQNVTERVSGPGISDGPVRTDYVYDCQSAVSGYSSGNWPGLISMDLHDDYRNYSPLGGYAHMFQRVPPYVSRYPVSTLSVSLTPYYFHYIDCDRPQLGEPVTVRKYRRVGSSDVLTEQVSYTYESAFSQLQIGWRVRHMLSGCSDEDRMNLSNNPCREDFFTEPVYRKQVYRRLKSETRKSYLDDNTEKTVVTEYIYGKGSRTSLTEVVSYPSPASPSVPIPPMGSILSPRLVTQTFDSDSLPRYSRYTIFPDELSGIPGCGWADALLAQGYRSPVGEEVLVGGTLPSAPASKSGRYVTWAYFTPADTGSGSLLRPSKTEVWRKEEGVANYGNVGPTVQYLAYDHWGDPLEIRHQDPNDGTDGQTVSYLWSYGGLRPVAEITGVGYAQAAQKIGPNLLTAIASASGGPSDYALVQIRMGMSQLPAAQYSLYTYDLPFGIDWTEDVSRRKTSFEYDGAGRLKAVRDGDGNLVEGHLYELTRGGSGLPNRITSLTYTASGAAGVPTSFSAAMNASDAIKEVTYLDGLGRTVQGVSVGAATNGKDLVTPYVPDFLDREDARAYLPYPATTSTSNAGSYRSGALSAQQSHYTGLYGSTEGTRAYTENVYELSARGRVTATSLPGFTERTVLSTAGSPGGSLPVLTFNPSTQTFSASGYYDEGYFTVSVTAGPDGSVTESWTDEFGTPVLERVRISGAAAGQPEDWAETRYVKDLRGRVLCVIPPAEYARLLRAAADNNGIVSSFSAEHCYTYKYDGRDRVVKRHLPDRVTDSLAYNNADLVTSTVRTAADGIGQETFTTTYDGFYRPTEETYRYGGGTAITLAKYFHDTNPTTLNFGGHTLPVPAFSPVSGVAETADKDSRTKGLKTAELIRVVSPDESPSAMTADASAQFIIRSFHYDGKGNLIQTAEKQFGTDTGVSDTYNSTRYDFTGKVLLSRESVALYSGGNAGQLDKAFTYDSRLRPTGMTAQLTSGGTSGPQGLLNYTYDDLGRTASLKRNSNTAETTTYGYTLQGWLSSASSPNYAETLRYANPSRAATDTLPGKAGLVTEWTSRQKGTTSTGGVSSSMTYAYSYDGAGRLTGSVRYNGSSSSKLSTLTEKGISYDPNGNLLALKRYGSSSGTTPTDNLSFTYTGTKRTGYAYDAHGNVTSDPTNGTAIQWNVLGLPKSISDGTDTARRVYAADGTLLAVYDGTTGTAGRIYAGGLTLVRTAAGTLSLEGAAWEGGRLIAGTGSDKVLYQETDHLGSVRVVKDGSGDVRQRFDYYPFGKVSRAWTDGTDVDYAHRWRFGGKEIAGQKMGASAPAGIAAAAAGSPYLDFGARLYDPRTAAWLSQDPLSEKYYSISPYAYCAGNPVNLVDPDGSFLRILFFESNQWFSFSYSGIETAIPDNPYVHAVIDAYKFDKENWINAGFEGDSPIAALVESKDIKVSIYEKIGEDNQFFTENGGLPFIIWNPYEGIETDLGVILSPASILAHEADHAISAMTDAKAHSLRKRTKDSLYENAEEKRVITGTEQKTALANGEIQRGHVTRRNHKGETVYTEGVTSTTIDQAATAYYRKYRKRK